MKQIGLRQADGSFYPILEEGVPGKKTVGLTTAKDNQTRVLVDLYRSSTGTMEDADYVDSLQIDNLVAHPNGSAEIKLNIGLDEDGKLSAELIDPETGATSNANVTLVSRTLEERLGDSADATITSEPDLAAFDGEFSTDEAAEGDAADSEAVANDVAAEPAELVSDKDGDMPFDASALTADDFALPEGDLSLPEDSASDEATSDDVALPDMDFSDLDDFGADTITETPDSVETETDDAEPKSDGAAFATGAAAGAVAGGLAAAAALHQNDDGDDATEPTDDSAFDLPDFGDTTEPSADSASLDDGAFDLPDFESDDTVASDDIAASEDALSADTSSFDLDLPDFGDSDSASDDATAESYTATESTDDSAFDLPDFGDTTEPSADSASLDDGAFDLPDFGSDDTVVSDDIAPSEDVSDADASSFDLPDFEDDAYSAPAPDSTAEMIKHSSALQFDGLYDKETMDGDSSIEDEEDEEVTKKTRVPVIICIICAIICILATILVLFIVPSKYNLLNKHPAAKSEPVEVVKEEPIPEPEPQPEPEPEPEPEIIEAKEDEIVVVEEPEKIVPEPPKEPELPPADITYKIKWGDTLWDIADAYYKNPWNYKKIARYNNIRNPDYIISGTYIKIPAK